MNQWPHDRLEEKLDQLLLDYLDARLDPETRVRLQQHLATCPECRTRIEENQAFAGLHEKLIVPNQSAEPSTVFAARLKMQIQNEASMPNTQKRIIRSRWLTGYRNFSRMTAAAVLVVLISAGGLLTYRLQQQNNLFDQPATATTTLPAAMMAEQAVSPAAEPTGGNAQEMATGNQIALDSANGFGNPSEETTAGARLFSKAAPESLWRDAWAENMVLPLHNKKVPDQPVLTRELLAGAKAVIWILPDVLIVAFDQDQIDSQLEDVAQLSQGYDPSWTTELRSEESIQEFLAAKFGSEIAAEISGIIIIQDCRYLILTIGGN